MLRCPPVNVLNMKAKIPPLKQKRNPPILSLRSFTFEVTPIVQINASVECTLDMVAIKANKSTEPTTRAKKSRRKKRRNQHARLPAAKHGRSTSRKYPYIKSGSAFIFSSLIYPTYLPPIYPSILHVEIDRQINAQGRSISSPPRSPASEAVFYRLLTPIKLKNSFLVFSFRSKHPSTQLVIVVVLVFSTPLMTMHK